MEDLIKIRGARTHNLKNIDIDIPRNQLVVITGLSGSGKSSLAFDTIYAEGQRRYTESLSAYARQFLSVMEKPDVDTIEGLSPAISIQQKAASHNPRSTVGTITEVHDYIRLLYARAGTAYCPDHNLPLKGQVPSQMTDTILTSQADKRILILAPIVRERKGEYHNLFQNLKQQGFVRVRVDGEIFEIAAPIPMAKNKKHNIEVIVDRLRVKEESVLRISESLETALRLSDGLAMVAPMDDTAEEPLVFSSRFSCPKCDYSIAELEPRLFSFNNPAGACPECQGLGHKSFFDPQYLIQEYLSINEGAIKGWGPSRPYYFHLVKAVAKANNISLTKPFKKLSIKQKETLLYGNQKNNSFSGNHFFEGIIPHLERKYHETDSSIIQEELKKYLSFSQCPACNGSRLCQAARNVRIENHNIPHINNMPIDKSLTFFNDVKLKGKEGVVAEKILKEIRTRLHFLADVGLGYLTLSRSAETLSGGEAQRIRLASQIGSGLVGVIYVLDEPSIGLHQRDNVRLLNTLKKLRNLGNSVLVVEHDEETIMEADHILDIGPGAGIHGGKLVASGTVKDLTKNKHSLTGDYLSKRKKINLPNKRVLFDKEQVIYLKGATGNNLKNLEVEIPVGLFTCITGVSGSGKSSLINNTLYPIAARKLNHAGLAEALPCSELSGLELLDKVINVNQSPIGRTPRSNPATYTGVFTHVRDLFAATTEARARGYRPGRFSFNVRGGRCEACQGDGLIKIEMHFLSDVYVPCDTCKGKRYGRETLEIKYRGKNIHEILEMTVEEAADFFTRIPPLAQKLNMLMEVGLSYIKLGHSALALSGGEAQRIKLAKELSKKSTNHTLYILDEPTTGLHFHDVKQLLAVLHRLRDMNNTVIVIEHNLDVIKTADWIIDMGPEGGANGGEIVATGTPEILRQNPKSFTGQFLKKMIGN